MVNKSYSGKKILVLGLGVSGRSAVKFLLERGGCVVGVDNNETTLQENEEIVRLRDEGLKTFLDTELQALDSFDLLVTSPGVPQTHPLYKMAREKGIEVIGEVELACREVSNPFLGITGTNGKTTVSMLVGHVLNFSGRKAKVLGNFGIPLTSQLPKDSEEIIVCELSSYQLETLQSQVIDYGVVLNITPDHLDRYRDMDEYASAKIKMGHCIKAGGKFFVGENVLHEFGNILQGLKAKAFGFNSQCDVFCDKKSIFIKENIELLLPDHYRGKSSHDVENIMVAFALCSEMEVDADTFVQALGTFEKPPHRIEFVRSMCGVNFYNDSKGTNLDAVIRAVESMPGKVVLIAGGQAKGTRFFQWQTPFADKVRYICAIGEAKSEIDAELSGKYPVECFDSLENAVNRAFAIAQEGENVLLSPGCASFDMFKNFEHRGDRFKEIVFALEG